MNNWVGDKVIWWRPATEFFLLKALVFYFFSLGMSHAVILWSLKHDVLVLFPLIQVVLATIWCLLHALRLREAGRGVAAALGVSLIYMLAMDLLYLVSAFLPGELQQADSILSVEMLKQFVTFSRGVGDPVSYLALLAFLALLIPPVFSVWAALQSKRSA